MDDVKPRIADWTHALDESRADLAAGRIVDGADLHDRLDRTIADLKSAAEPDGAMRSRRSLQAPNRASLRGA